MAHFELIFVRGLTSVSRLLLLHMDVQSSRICWRDRLFPITSPSFLCQGHAEHVCAGQPPCPVHPCVCSLPRPRRPNYCGFTARLNAGRRRGSNSVLPQCRAGSSVRLLSHMGLRPGLSLTPPPLASDSDDAQPVANTLGSTDKTECFCSMNKEHFSIYLHLLLFSC